MLFIYKDYPLEEIHPWAVHAAVNANCLDVAEQGCLLGIRRLPARATSARSALRKGRDGQNDELDKLAAVQGQKHNLDFRSCRPA